MDPRPSPPSAGAKRPKDRKARIIAAASRMFCERGYHAVNMDDVGEAVGITGPAVYRHFGSKEALLVAVAEEMVESYLARCREAVADTDTPEERLRALARGTIGPQIEENNFWALAQGELRHLPRKMVRRINTDAAEIVQLWVEPLRALHPGHSDEELEFMAIVGAGLASSLVHYQPQLSRGRVVDLLMQMLMSAYLHDGREAVSKSARHSAGPAPKRPAWAPQGPVLEWSSPPRRASGR